MNFNDLLREAGLGGYSGFFGTGEQVAKSIGFSGDAVGDFAQFFQKFNKEDALKFASSIAENVSTGTENVMGQFGSGQTSLRGSLEAATGKIQDYAAKSGASFGATEKQMRDVREKSSTTFADLMRRKDMGLQAVEQQRGREQAALTSLLSGQISNVYGRAQDIYSLDPNMGDIYSEAPTLAGSNFNTPASKYNPSQPQSQRKNPSDPFNNLYYNEENIG
jgi:hypothetical protein|tara:strand:- start:180 stop:839 length:660 start_codon:yes stop_codon:yes gene_type:complete